MGKPNFNQLAMRDPALAAALGVHGESSNFGAVDFGHSPDFGTEFGDDPAPAPTQANLQKAWSHYQGAAAQAAHTKKREMLLEPNKGSTTKIERYVFQLSQALVLGTASALSMNDKPSTAIRPQKVVMNAPAPGFCTLSSIQVANVNVTIGSTGVEDAWSFNANATDSELDMPTLSPSNNAKIAGNYTGYVPSGYVSAAAFTFTASFKGPATITA